MIDVEVPLGDRAYPVLVGDGALGRLASLLPGGARRAAVVTQAAVPVEVDTGVEQRVFAVGAGEDAKSLATLDELCRDWAAWGLTRADVVVAVGGGVVTDLAGFAASVYHRGVPVVHVATTLLAQVDAAIGGKTGVNLPEGKNLVGTFWQPAAVVCDTATLASLPPREWASGRGEMAKYAFLGVDDLARLPLDRAVAACVAAKAAAVAADEREGGARALLNYGHTLAHALETAGGYGLRHGEAVAVGLVFAARLARRLGRVDDARVAAHEALVRGYGLPDRLPDDLGGADLVALMGRDKKVLDGGLTFVLDGPAGLEVVRGVDAADVQATLAEIAP
ncbi:MAG TPA: 3-dehydroquinate synthase family protein [Acidimicrobiales bacterium]|nr:3-dehydroquinate synthase family protein [Acidimicrobiales bacterium]